MAAAVMMQVLAVANDWQDAPEISLYRKYTKNILQRYFRCSIELGRLPAPLGKGLGFLRAKASAYKVSSFEDTMVFVCDVEKCLKQLSEFEQAVIHRMVLQDFSEHETADLLRCARSTVADRYRDALDELSTTFLHKGILKPGF
jgi:hypothetical protein